MKTKSLSFSLIVTVILLGIGGWLVLFFHMTGTANHPAVLSGAMSPGAMANGTAGALANGAQPLEVAFNPPALEDAPAKNREAVLLGYKIMTETKKYAGEYVGNNLACTNCHFDGGRSKDTISLVGVASVYPHYRSRANFSTDLTLRTMDCFQRSMNSVAPPADSKIMQALTAYYQWISKGIPIYAEVPWIGLPKMPEDHKPDPAAGGTVYKDVCARCHGAEGQGTPIAPAVWGPGSYNDGAGMNRVTTFSAFAWRFMPKASPSLTKEQALDVAAFVHAKPRPHYAKPGAKPAGNTPAAPGAQAATQPAAAK
ncbi:MAG: cytochrome C [Desulfovibrionaceae bacterium CG1_02_65_16]|nr:MAG: cytochrome C [Desulfovibrionaceae bacterium CG1_02_65_16]